MNVQIEESWKTQLKNEFEQPYFFQLTQFLKEEKAAGKTIYPPGPQLFEAFRLTTFDNVKVVILGQDPYHGLGQAHGLSFSVPRGIALPPSLKNIFKELEGDLDIAPSHHGHLESWAKEGVLLLNSALTVEAGLAGSHSQIGWQQFTNAVIEILSKEKQKLVFILWGNFAKSKQQLIDGSKHLILTSAHPSPLSAYNGFFGSRCFSKANNFLIENKLKPVQWELPQS